MINNHNFRTFLETSFRTRANKIIIIKVRKVFLSFQGFKIFSVSSEHKILLCPVRLYVRFKSKGILKVFHSNHRENLSSLRKIP
jgi:hypothetical protein